jgi:hypothetical protein
MVDSCEPPKAEEIDVTEQMSESRKNEKLVEEGTRMLNGREADNALLENI